MFRWWPNKKRQIKEAQMDSERAVEERRRQIAQETMARLLEVDAEGWKAQLPQMKAHYAKFGDKLPAALHAQLQALEQRLNA